ncbi:MAG TPA: amidase family protein, partial [Terriglobales bacterium]|nr:amidase family protein [Terriglobales bacterium]
NEATISQIEHAYQTHLLTPQRLIGMYLARIKAYDGTLNSYMLVNPHALDTARELERQHEDGDRDRDDRSQPLYGIPVVVKDNNDTFDMPTTAGSVALGGSVPPDDATIVKKIRRAGGIILGKGTLTEFANFISDHMPSGYSSQLRLQLAAAGGNPALVGYGFNPFDPRPDPRTAFADGRPALTPGGSSSGPGIAVSANLATVGIGTETSGSILSPGTMNLLVGIKPTVGLVSRDGIVPITADQDTAGPLARTVTDAAKLLGVIAGFDPKDPATAACLKPGNCFSDYTQFLDKNALRGARIAVPHYGYWDQGDPDPTKTHFVVISAEQEKIMNDAIAVLRAEGATVVDPYDIPDESDLLKFGTCVVLPPLPDNCTSVLLFGFKRDLNSYLASLGPNAPVKSMDDVFNFNKNHSDVALKYGQILVQAANMLNTSAGSNDTKRYIHDRTQDLLLSRTNGLDKVFAAGFDAVLFPANRGANIAARAGYPSIVVPGGFYSNPAVQACLSDPTPCPFNPPTPFPAGFNAQPAPYGVTFSGPAFSEPRLIALAYAFEQATHHRTSPPSAPPLPSDTVHRN